MTINYAKATMTVLVKPHAQQGVLQSVRSPYIVLERLKQPLLLQCLHSSAEAAHTRKHQHTRLVKIILAGDINDLKAGVLGNGVPENRNDDEWLQVSTVLEEKTGE